MSTSITKRATAMLGALALGVIAAVGAVAPASAVTAPGNIDPNIARSLTVHKYELDATSPQLPGTGQLLPGGIPGATPLEGATFTATVVQGVDLNTTAGWTAASTLTPTTAAPSATGASFTATTDSNGLATFANMPLGLYLVTETGVPATVTNPAAPFLVTLPFPTGANAPANQWIYDVHVYPKNAVTELTKTRVAPAAGSVEARNPDLVRWAIAGSIPTLTAGDTLSTFSLSDTLDPNLAFVDTPPTGVAPTGVTVTNATGGVQTFELGTDYTVTTTGAVRTLDFTPAGRLRLQGLGGGNVTFTVLTRAVSVPEDGRIINTATSVVNGATETVTGVTPIGELTVLAYSPTPAGEKTPLAGAVYEVFLTQEDANNRVNQVTVGGATQWTSAANGLVTVPIITPGNYFVREVTAPVGFQIPTQSISPVQVVAGESSTIAPARNYLEFAHLQVPAWALPLTGGDGALWFGVGGGAILLIGLGAAVVVARRRGASARVPA